MTSMTWRDRPRHPRTVWPWLRAVFHRFAFGPAATIAPEAQDDDTQSMPRLRECLYCRKWDIVDEWGWCPPCVALTAEIDAVAAQETAELDRVVVEPVPDPEPAPEPTVDPEHPTLFDYLALGVIAASTGEDDAVLNAQIMLAERRDVDSIVAGLTAFVAAHPLALAGTAVA